MAKKKIIDLSIENFCGDSDISFEFFRHRFHRSRNAALVIGHFVRFSLGTIESICSCALCAVWTLDLDRQCVHRHGAGIRALVRMCGGVHHTQQHREVQYVQQRCLLHSALCSGRCTRLRRTLRSRTGPGGHGHPERTVICRNVEKSRSSIPPAKANADICRKRLRASHFF